MLVNNASAPALGSLLYEQPYAVLSLSAIAAISIALLYRRSASSSPQLSPASSAAQMKQQAAARLSVDEPDRLRVRVMFGTQTGTAERWACGAVGWGEVGLQQRHQRGRHGLVQRALRRGLVAVSAPRLCICPRSVPSPHTRLSAPLTPCPMIMQPHAHTQHTPSPQPKAPHINNHARFAKQLGSELRKRHGEATAVEVLDLENYDAPSRLAREKLVVLCVATYGDGEPTDNAADFFSWLGKEAEAVAAGEKEPGHLQVRVRWLRYRLSARARSHAARGGCRMRLLAASSCWAPGMDGERGEEAKPARPRELMWLHNSMLGPVCLQLRSRRVHAPRVGCRGDFECSSPSSNPHGEHANTRCDSATNQTALPGCPHTLLLLPQT